MTLPSYCECCPVFEDPCNGLVLGVFQPIILVILIGILVRVLLQYLPDAGSNVPSWANLLILILIELLFGYYIQRFGCVRNMWKNPSCKGLITAFFFIILFPILLPVLLKVV